MYLIKLVHSQFKLNVNKYFIYLYFRPKSFHNTIYLNEPYLCPV